MKNISVFFSALVALLFSVAETSAQITPPYYNPANVAITGGNINNTVIGGTTAAAGSFSTLTANTLFTVGNGNTTNAGWILGYLGASGYGAAWNTGVIPSTTNYVIAGNSSQGILNGTTSSNIAVANVVKFESTSALNTSVNPLSITNATDSSSTITGSLKTAGGLGVAKTLYVGTGIDVTGTSTLRGTVALTNVAITGVAQLALNNGSKIVQNDPADYDVALYTGSPLTRNFLFYGNGSLGLTKTITTPGTTGAVTINKTTGRVNFAAAATSLVVTNSLATANSICHVTKATNDATMRLGACVAAAGSITIYADVAPAAETAVNFTVTN